MRPVKRDDVPTDAKGNSVLFAHYREARDPLIDRIGDFCSYCEVALHDQVDVEHVLPKKHNTGLITKWSNFLLACSVCNSIKGSTDCQLADYFWPDVDNTARAFVYEPDKAPKVDGALSQQEQRLAQATIDLTGIDRLPGHPKYSRRDRRWLKRKEAWGIASESLKNLQGHNCPEMRRQIELTAKSRGYWSIWMQVFRADPDMRQRLIDGFPGTARDCFDANTQPVARPGGQI